MERLPYSRLMRWTRDAREINDKVFRLLDNESFSRRPFFLFLNYMDAHRPYLAPGRFATMFPGRDANFGARQFDGLLADVLSGKRSITPAERNHIVSQYDGSLAWLDDQLGALFSRLKQLGLYENTLLIVTSDHGEAFGDKDLLEHGSSVYQDQVGVPLIIRYPRQTTARVVDARTSGVDILPTVLDVLALPCPNGVQGRSVRNLAATDSTPAMAESYAPGIVMGLHRRFRTTERAVFVGQWKLVESRRGPRELYDLSQDPRETRNLYGAEAPVRTELERLLAQLSARGAQAPSKPVVVDPATMERLRGLGYLK
jgi:arylsulfatase A-like enzyme